MSNKTNLPRCSTVANMASDYLRFQEMIMGHGVRLAFHEPVQKITIKKSDSFKSTQDCESQMLRLWQYSSKQTMMFYANIADTNREFNSKHASPLNTPRLTYQCNTSALLRRNLRSSFALTFPCRINLGGNPDQRVQDPLTQARIST